MRVTMFMSGSLLFGFFVEVLGEGVCFYLLCFVFATWAACGCSHARDRTRATAATRATAVRTQEPPPTRPSENSPNLSILRLNP